MSVLQRILILFVITWINYKTTSTAIIESKINQPIYEKDDGEILKLQDRVKRSESQILSEGEVKERFKNTDVIQLNVGGEIMMTTRETLTQCSKSVLSIMFNGHWEQKLPKDKKGNIFLDFNPILFRHLLDQLQILEKNNITNFYPPSQFSLIEPFKKMLRHLDLDQYLPLENNIISFNVGGQIITNQRKTFNQIFNSTLDSTVSSSTIIKFDNKSNIFLDYDPKLFQHFVKQLRKNSFKNTCYRGKLSHVEKVFFKRIIPALNICLLPRSSLIDISPTAKWKKNGHTIAGKNPTLSKPYGLYVDDNQTIYVADHLNHRIVAWKSGETNGQVVAGGYRQESGAYELNRPTDVIVDKERHSLIVCDWGNQRVIQWPLQYGTSVKTIISNISCIGLTMDENGSLYVTDEDKHEVRRYRVGETQGIVVAGGNGQGNGLNQLDSPSYIFVDREQSVYVSDSWNHRVVKWIEGAKEGIVVAGGQEQGNTLTQLNRPHGILVDQLGTIYIADEENNRIVRWLKGEKRGNIIVGGNGNGIQANQLNWPVGLSFDQHGHLYVAEYNNNRVQRFTIEISSNQLT